MISDDVFGCSKLGARFEKVKDGSTIACWQMLREREAQRSTRNTEQKL